MPDEQEKVEACYCGAGEVCVGQPALLDGYVCARDYGRRVMYQPSAVPVPSPTDEPTAKDLDWKMGFPFTDGKAVPVPSGAQPEKSAAECAAFRAGWATGFQECAEGATIDWSQETGERPALETAALERWLFVEAASRLRPEPPLSQTDRAATPAQKKEI